MKARQVLKTKTGEVIFGVALVSALFLFSRFCGPPLLITTAVIGLIVYGYLFRERYRGRWLRFTLSLLIGLALGAAIVMWR